MSSKEYKLQVAVVKHIESAFPGILYFHVPNQTRDATEAFFNKQLGVKAGIGDLILAWRGGQGMLELKTDIGRVSSQQNKMLSAFHAIGWHTGVARTVAQAHHIFCMWGLTPKHWLITEPDYATGEEKLRRGEDYFKT